MAALRADPSVLALTVADFPGDPRNLLDRWREVAGIQRSWRGGLRDPAIPTPARGAKGPDGRKKMLLG
jgi:hypothetical protein